MRSVIVESFYPIKVSPLTSLTKLAGYLFIHKRQFLMTAYFYGRVFYFK